MEEVALKFDSKHSQQCNSNELGIILRKLILLRAFPKYCSPFCWIDFHLIFKFKESFYQLFYLYVLFEYCGFLMKVCWVKLVSAPKQVPYFMLYWLANAFSKRNNLITVEKRKGNNLRKIWLSNKTSKRFTL